MLRDRNKAWWLVYDHEYEPVARKPFDLRALLAFGIRRMNASEKKLFEELSWETFFEVDG